MVLVVKNPPANAGREGTGTPLQYPRLENPMDGGAWWATVHGIAKSQTWLTDFTFTFHFYALEKEMATHSSVLAWRIPGTGEPGGLPSMGSHRVRHDWSDLAAATASAGNIKDPWVGKIPWRKKQQPTLVFLLGKCSWTEEPGGLQPVELQRVKTWLKRLSTQAHTWG